ncbi:hypothetical protein HF874_08325 [Parabacteroides distasonis]|uniref:hypothetical protein n=1 Tax=Parabacteroides distasonis TaxID=823 RepID=UPI0014743D90|nr:hypothetical protein [Parabacteroides distasonis]NME12836.1 hypothetical protein [Parabacteroides distasonis]
MIFRGGFGVRMALYGVDRGGTKGGGCERMRKAAAGTPAPIFSLVLWGESLHMSYFFY